VESVILTKISQKQDAIALLATLEMIAVLKNAFLNVVNMEHVWGVTVDVIVILDGKESHARFQFVIQSV